MAKYYIKGSNNLPLAFLYTLYYLFIINITILYTFLFISIGI